MLTEITLGQLTTISILAMLFLASLEMLTHPKRNIWYYLTDKSGNTSSVVFTYKAVHLKENRFWLNCRLIILMVIQATLTIALASFIVGTYKHDLGELPYGGYEHTLLFWFILAYTRRSLVEIAILNQVSSHPVKSVKIDGKKHYVGTMKKVPWLLQHRLLYSIITLFTVMIYINLVK